VVLLGLAACSYAPLDAQGGVDAPSMRKDAGGTCAAPASFASPTLASQVAEFFPGNQNTADQVEFIANLNATDFIDISLVDGAAPFSGDTIGAPETIPLTGNQLQFSTCGGCVIVVANCTTCTLSSDTFDGTPYMATAGTLTINDVNPSITGTLTNATFGEVTIDNNGVTTPVPGGCTTAITSASFNVAVQQ
jgi:hypothetical protein